MGNCCCHNKVEDRNKIYQLKQQNQQNDEHLVQEEPSVIDDLITKIKQPPGDHLTTRPIFSQRTEIQTERNQETLQQKLEEKDIEIENLKIQMNNVQEEARIRIKELNQEIDEIKKENYYDYQDSLIRQLKAKIQEQTKQIQKLNSELEDKQNEINGLNVDVFEEQDKLIKANQSFREKETIYKQKIQQYQDALEKLYDLKYEMNQTLKNQQNMEEKERIDDLIGQLEIEITNMVKIQPVKQFYDKVTIRFNGFQENKKTELYILNGCGSNGPAKLSNDGIVHCSNNCHYFMIEDAVFLFEKQLIIRKNPRTENQGATIKEVEKLKEFLEQCLQGQRLRYDKFRQQVIERYEEKKRIKQTQNLIMILQIKLNILFDGFNSQILLNKINTKQNLLMSRLLLIHVFFFSSSNIKTLYNFFSISFVGKC